jgi:O-antigen/teichoic acid export membrane protein
LIARQKIKVAAVFTVGGQMLVSITTVAVALVTGDLGAIFTGVVLARALQLLLMLLYVALPLQGFAATRYFFGIGAQLRYGLLLGLGGTGWVILNQAHQLFVSRYFDQESFAVYSAGCTSIPVVDFFVNSIALVSLGRFAALEQANDWDGIRRLWQEILTSLCGIAIPAILFLLLISEPLISFMFTESYAGALEIFRVNTLLKIAMIWNAQLVLRAMNRNEIQLILYFTLILVSPLLFFQMMKLVGGFYGVIWGQLLLLVTGRLGMLLILNRVSPVRLPYTVSLRQLWGFYRDNWHKGCARLSTLRSRG